ncbi:MAG: carboxypeptidase regulatory-like domain-containing protein, partial [Planctomycetes bacterium]|nr:carboxypeptidase regulatory-like domain-containing protein [Planctomycetota bacterium]
SATTDATGSYTIADVTPGDYTVTASATGYDSSSQPVTVVEGAVAPANFALVPTPPGTPTPGPTVTPTPTPVCEPESVSVSPTSLKLKRKKSSDVTVTVNGSADVCPGGVVAGETVTATINAAGKKRISVSPASATTDPSGVATFTITAKKTTGNARVTFKAGDVKKSQTVRVRK